MTSETSETALPDVTLADLHAERDEDKGIGLAERMIGAWVDMRASVRQLINEEPSEARLLFFVLLSDIIFFVSRTLSLVVSPGSATAKFLPLEIGAWLIGALLLRTATLYVFSGIVGFVCRALGGQGSWRDTRAAVFWASLVAAPIGVAGALVGAGFERLSADIPLLGTDAFVIAPLSIGIVAFVWFVSASVAEAQRFTRTSPVFIAFSLLAIFLSVAGIALFTRIATA